MTALPDNPRDEHAEALWQSVHGPALRAPEIVAACRDARAGFVVWDSSLPADTNWEKHRTSMLSAFHLAFMFCKTSGLNEWLVLGDYAYQILRELPQYTAEMPVECAPLVYVGRITAISVYVPIHDYAEFYDSVRLEGWFAGIGKSAARGLVSNSNLTIAKVW